MSLFDTSPVGQNREKEQRLAVAMDQLKKSFGNKAVRRGMLAAKP
jgi:hypothetical protein